MLQVKLAFSFLLYELEENKKCQVSLVVKYIYLRLLSNVMDFIYFSMLSEGYNAHVKENHILTFQTISPLFRHSNENYGSCFLTLSINFISAKSGVNFIL